MISWPRCKRIYVHLVRSLFSVFVIFSQKLIGFLDDDKQTTSAKAQADSFSSFPSGMNQNNNFQTSAEGSAQTTRRSRHVSGSSKDIYYKLFTVKRFKLLAVAIVVISACYHCVLHLKNGHNTCKWLLTDGRFQGYNEWQPHGCMMHKYSKGDFRNCMQYISYWGGKNHFAFVGDSRIRQLYFEFVKLLSNNPVHPHKAHSKLQFHDPKANVLAEFYWAPMVDQSMKEIFETWINPESTPRLIVAGSATWSIKVNNGSEEAIHLFKSNLTSISSTFSKYKEFPEVVWMLQDHVVEARLFPNRSMITNRQIDLYNKATVEILISSKAHIWSSSILIGQGFLGSDISPPDPIKPTTTTQSPSSSATNSAKTLSKISSNNSRPEVKSQTSTTSQVRAEDEGLDDLEEECGSDGLHLSSGALEWDIQVLLNMLCNNYMNFDDGSCCTNPENPTALQIALAAIFGASSVVAVVMTACRRLTSLSRKVNNAFLRRNGKIVLNGCGRFVATGSNSTGEAKQNYSSTEIKDNASPVIIRQEGSSIVGVEDAGGVDNTAYLSTTFHEISDQIQEGKDEDACDLVLECPSPPPSPFIHHPSSFHQSSGQQDSDVLDFYTVVCCVARLGLVLFYFFICDRTTFFMKENKYYTHVNFFLPFTYLMVLGLFFTENTKQMQVLNRNQTDEWKGWMQIVILIYHLTGASKVLSIYMQIRVMVSTYLFLSAYGHFAYFFTKGDFSFHRLCTVVVRFNFLVVLLCLAMNRTYQFYYFVPLVSFWFVIIYFVMASPPRVCSTTSDGNTTAYCWLIFKIIALTAFITLLYSSEVFFEKIFLSYFLKPLFASSDESVYEWRFRWSLDRYSSIHGLIFSLILVAIKKARLIDDSNGSDLISSKKITLVSIFASLCGLVGYAIFTSLCQNKDQCNETHSYIAFVPILCYIIIRNMLGCARKKFSAFFAWFGKISLELFIAQYHIWLAADTHGVLVLVPSYPVLNLIVTSFVFVCVAHEIKTITNTLLPLLVPNSRVSLLRNLIFVVVFIVARHFVPL